jgi:hypothetical protein
MTTYVLLNTIKFGSNLLKSGSVIDDACYDTAGIGTAGGLLTLTGNALINAAATAVQGWWKSGSRDQQVCDAAMLAAYGLAGQTYELAHDHVDNESAHTHSVASSGASTPAITCATDRRQQTVQPSAPGGNYHAQFAAGAPIDHAIAGGEQLIINVPSRTVQIARGGAGNATVYTIDGTADDGTTIQDILNSAGAATIQGAKAFATITRIRSDVNPGVTTDLQVGNGFGLGGPVSNIDLLGCAGAKDTIVSSDVATGTVVPTTVPDGTKTFDVRYRVVPTATNAAHDHGAVTGAGSAHNHTLS